MPRSDPLLVRWLASPAGGLPEAARSRVNTNLEEALASGYLLAVAALARADAVGAPLDVRSASAALVDTPTAAGGNLEVLARALAALGLPLSSADASRIAGGERGAAAAVVLALKQVAETGVGAAPQRATTTTTPKLSSGVATRGGARAPPSLSIVQRLLAEGKSVKTAAMEAHLADLALGGGGGGAERGGAEVDDLAPSRAGRTGAATSTLRASGALPAPAGGEYGGSAEDAMARIRAIERAEVAAELTSAARSAHAAAAAREAAAADAATGVAGVEAAMRRQGVDPYGPASDAGLPRAAAAAASTTASHEARLPGARPLVGAVPPARTIVPPPRETPVGAVLRRVFPTTATQLQATLGVGAPAGSVSDGDPALAYQQRIVTTLADTLRPAATDEYASGVDARVGAARAARRDKDTRGRVMAATQAAAQSASATAAAASDALARYVAHGEAEVAPAAAAYDKAAGRAARDAAVLTRVAAEDARRATAMASFMDAQRARLSVETERAVAPARSAGHPVPRLPTRDAAPTSPLPDSPPQHAPPQHAPPPSVVVEDAAAVVAGLLPAGALPGALAPWEQAPPPTTTGGAGEAEDSYLDAADYADLVGQAGAWALPPRAAALALAAAAADELPAPPSQPRRHASSCAVSALTSANDVRDCLEAVAAALGHSGSVHGGSNVGSGSTAADGVATWYAGTPVALAAPLRVALRPLPPGAGADAAALHAAAAARLAQRLAMVHVSARDVVALSIAVTQRAWARCAALAAAKLPPTSPPVLPDTLLPALAALPPLHRLLDASAASGSRLQLADLHTPGLSDDATWHGDGSEASLYDLGCLFVATVAVALRATTAAAVAASAPTPAAAAPPPSSHGATGGEAAPPALPSCLRGTVALRANIVDKAVRGGGGAGGEVEVFTAAARGVREGVAEALKAAAAAAEGAAAGAKGGKGGGKAADTKKAAGGGAKPGDAKEKGGKSAVGAPLAPAAGDRLAFARADVELPVEEVASVVDRVAGSRQFAVALAAVVRAAHDVVTAARAAGVPRKGYGGVLLVDVPRCGAHLLAVEHAWAGPLLWSPAAPPDASASVLSVPPAPTPAPASSHTAAAASPRASDGSGASVGSSSPRAGGGEPGAPVFRVDGMVPSEWAPEGWDGMLPTLLDAYDAGTWRLPRAGAEVAHEWRALVDAAAVAAGLPPGCVDGNGRLNSARAKAATGLPPGAGSTASAVPPSGSGGGAPPAVAAPSGGAKPKPAAPAGKAGGKDAPGTAPGSLPQQPPAPPGACAVDLVLDAGAALAGALALPPAATAPPDATLIDLLTGVAFQPAGPPTPWPEDRPAAGAGAPPSSAGGGGGSGGGSAAAAAHATPAPAPAAGGKEKKGSAAAAAAAATARDAAARVEELPPGLPALAAILASAVGWHLAAPASATLPPHHHPPPGAAGSEAAGKEDAATLLADWLAATSRRGVVRLAAASAGGDAVARAVRAVGAAELWCEAIAAAAAPPPCDATSGSEGGDEAPAGVADVCAALLHCAARGAPLEPGTLAAVAGAHRASVASRRAAACSALRTLRQLQLHVRARLRRGGRAALRARRGGGGGSGRGTPAPPPPPRGPAPIDAACPPPSLPPSPPPAPPSPPPPTTPLATARSLIPPPPGCRGAHARPQGARHARRQRQLDAELRAGRRRHLHRVRHTGWRGHAGAGVAVQRPTHRSGGVEGAAG